MSHSDQSINPFAELFSDAQPNIPINKHLIGQEQDSENLDDDTSISNKIENIFQISLNPDTKTNLFLPQLYVELNSQIFLNEDNLNQAVFERLLISQEDYQKFKHDKKDWEILPYLHNCYERLYQEIPENANKESRIGKLQNNIKDTIICNSSTALQSPDLYGQDISMQFTNLLKQLYTSSKNKHLNEYLVLMLSNVNDNFDFVTLSSVCTPILDKVKEQLAKLSIVDSTLFDTLEMIEFFLQKPFLCRCLITHSTPDFLNKLNGHAYEEPLPKTNAQSSTSSSSLNNASTTNPISNNNETLNAFREAFDRGLRNVNLQPDMAQMFGGRGNNRSTTTPNYGKLFEDTLLGKAIGISCIPTLTKNRGVSLFFNNVSQLSRQEHKSMEQNLWKPLSSLVEKLYGVFYALLKADAEVKHLTLKWIGYCLHCNAGRAKIWSTELPEVFAATYASDPFMLNLGAILLKLCKPFSFPNGERLLKIDTSYSTKSGEPKTDEEAKLEGKHMIDMSKETTLITLEITADQIPGTNTSNYNFITECLFMTEKCLDIGFRVIVSKYLKLNQELGRLQVYYESAMASNPGATAESNPTIRNIKDAMEKGLSTFLSTKAALLEPVFLENFFNMSVAFCQYLCYRIHELTSIKQRKDGCGWDKDTTYFTPPSWASSCNLEAGTALAFHDVQSFLCTIPEFFLENIFDLMTLLSHFSDENLEYYGPQALEVIMVMVMTLMGSPNRVKNPHLRAKMAETMEALIPVSAKRSTEDEDSFESFNQGYSFSNRNWSLTAQESSCRAQLFKLESATPIDFGSVERKEILTAPYTAPNYHNYIFPILIHVFVSIEETGQNVAFEQKFSYRRPMYVVMKYLWKNPEHRKIAKMMADEAEKNIEAINPPLFLRFINLLINDAIFLLDEALSFMSQIRELLFAKDNHEWDKLTPEQKHEKENSLQHLGLMARYHNVLGLETIRVIDYITRYIYTIFTHTTMVNRIANMLNYFLLHLVGPKKKNFKVKDLTAYEFKPPEIVTTICQIYVNLGNTVDIFRQNIGFSKHEYLEDQVDQYGNRKKSLKTLDDKETIELMKRSEESFCRAVSLDGRSYSPELFKQAIEVLYKIGNKAASSYSSFNTYTKASNLSTELEIVAKKVKGYATEYEQEDEMTIDAPDEFLDPIMSTLMLNPVILPTSGKVVDRSTIARHLLSDQSDPFNRLPLTMEMIKSDIQLKEKITTWRNSKNNAPS